MKKEEIDDKLFRLNAQIYIIDFHLKLDYYDTSMIKTFQENKKQVLKEKEILEYARNQIT